jgi:hypothetical protein
MGTRISAIVFICSVAAGCADMESRRLGQESADRAIASMHESDSVRPDASPVEAPGAFIDPTPEQRAFALANYRVPVRSVLYSPGSASFAREPDVSVYKTDLGRTLSAMGQVDAQDSRGALRRGIYQVRWTWTAHGWEPGRAMVTGLE